MMLDDANTHEHRPSSTPGVGGAGGAARNRTQRLQESVTPIPAVPMADRGMPIELARTPELVHAWLDGEVPTSAVRGPEWAQHVEFWSRVDRDVESRRHLHAPADLAERIMAALPEASPRVAVPWWSRRLTINPLIVLAAAVGLLALGAAIGMTYRH